MIQSSIGTAVIGIQIPPGKRTSNGINAEKLEIKGHIVGDFIVYHTMIWKDNDYAHLKNWAINHIPTGLMIVSRIANLAKAKEYAEKLNQLFPKHGWTFGMPFYQNMFVTPEQTRSVKTFVQAIPTEPLE